MTDQEVPIKNSPFSEEELQHFEQLLNKEKEESKSKITEFEDRLSELEENHDDTQSSSAHHQGDIASSENERDKQYSLIQKEKNKIDEIDAALDRIKKGMYGVCESTGKTIRKERLRVKPYARYCVKAVKEANAT